MKKIKQTASQVLAALNSLEGIQPASPGPYFYTRLQARMSRTELNFWEKLGAVISRPTVALATICLILMINGIAIFQQKELPTSLPDQSEMALVDEYNNVVTSFYDYENPEP